MMVRNKRKAQMGMSFAWLFAIIVGAVILFIAIYSSTRVFDVGESAAGARTAKEISVLLNPLEIGFESGVVVLLKMPIESRIENECDNIDHFGRQGIKVSQKTFGKWQETNASTGFPNKYIFSENITEGEEFFIFSKPFEFPYKVSDLVYLTPTNKDYCFIGAPAAIQDELEDLGQENIMTGNCTENSVKICFSGSGDCDVKVDSRMKKVDKRGQVSYYETDALMYAAIFADNHVYECNVKRLMARAEELAVVYEKKSSLISTQGCTEQADLLGLQDAFSQTEDSSDLVFLKNIVSEVDRQNSVSACNLW